MLNTTHRYTRIMRSAPVRVLVIFVAVLLFGTGCGHGIALESTKTAPQAYRDSVPPEKIQFPSTDSDLGVGTSTILDGYLFRPTGNGPFPAIVALHGCSGLFTSGSMNARFADWGRRLAGLGYVVLFPDSFNPRGIREACTRKDRKSFSPNTERVRDANGALRWLQSQAFVRGDAVGLMGWSNGGSTTLAAIDASKKENNKDFRVAVAFYPGCTSFARKETWLPRIPLTILIGEADDWTPAASCQSLVEHVRRKGRNADLVIFPHAYHDFDHPGLPLKTRKGLAFTVSKDGTATVGTNVEARDAARALVPQILERYLKETGK